MSSRKKLVHPYCPDEVGRRRRIRGNVWGDDETETLLKLWKAPGVQGELRSVKRNQHVYAFIANQLKHNGVKVSRTRGYTMVSAYLLWLYYDIQSYRSYYGVWKRGHSYQTNK